MESSVEELGDLKYSIALEISLEEIKPTYDAVYKELKKLASMVFDQESTPPPPKAGLKSVLNPQCKKKLWTE